MGNAEDISNKEMLSTLMQRFDTFEALKADHIKLKAKVDKIEQQQFKLADEVCILSSELAQNQQEPLAAKAILRGLPDDESVNNCLLSVVKMVLKKCLPGSQNNLLSVERIGRIRKDEKGRPVLLTFSDHDKQQESIKAFRSKPPTLADIIFNDKTTAGKSSDHLYLNEHLGRLNAKTYFNARKLLKSGAVEFAWCSDGKIFVRAEEGAPAKWITHVSQLTQFLGNKQQEEGSDDLEKAAPQPQRTGRPKHIRNISGGSGKTSGNNNKVNIQ